MSVTPTGSFKTCMCTTRYTTRPGNKASIIELQSRHTAQHASALCIAFGTGNTHGTAHPNASGTCDQTMVPPLVCRRAPHTIMLYRVWVFTAAHCGKCKTRLQAAARSDIKRECDSVANTYLTRHAALGSKQSLIASQRLAARRTAPTAGPHTRTVASRVCFFASGQRDKISVRLRLARTIDLLRPAVRPTHAGMEQMLGRNGG